VTIKMEGSDCSSLRYRGRGDRAFFSVRKSEVPLKGRQSSWKKEGFCGKALDHSKEGMVRPKKRKGAGFSKRAQVGRSKKRKSSLVPKSRKKRLQLQPHKPHGERGPSCSLQNKKKKKKKNKKKNKKEKTPPPIRKGEGMRHSTRASIDEDRREGKRAL